MSVKKIFKINTGLKISIVNLIQTKVNISLGGYSQSKTPYPEGGFCFISRKSFYILFSTISCYSVIYLMNVFFSAVLELISS